jgi:hypothetical protein
VVDLPGLGLGTGWLGQGKCGDARIFQAHGAFARRASQFLPTAT